MFLYIGADHRGWQLKTVILDYLRQQGYQPQDVGNEAYVESDDYPDFAVLVAKQVSAATQGGTTEAKGILICGSGAGVDIVANKFEGVRSVLGFNNDQVFDARRDDNVNVLSLPAGFIAVEEAKQLVHVFLNTPFSDE